MRLSDAFDDLMPGGPGKFAVETVQRRRHDFQSLEKPESIPGIQDYSPGILTRDRQEADEFDLPADHLLSDGRGTVRLHVIRVTAAI